VARVVTAVEDLDPGDPRGPGDVLAAAFREDPTLRWCFGGDEPGFEERLRGYLEVGHGWHTGLGHPLHGVRADGALVGVSYPVLPDVEVAPQQVEALRAALVERCGRRWAERFAAYNERVDARIPDGRFHGLALVGVLPEHRGRGLGALLVDRVSSLCDADPRSEGVVLDTGNPRNVAFYERRGFRVVDEIPFEGFTERVMLRPRAGADSGGLGGTGA
jgi:GNAT superfamily N-acetyltransferase